MARTDARAHAASRPRRVRCPSRDGYTLVEVLVVLAIASIMAAMMTGGLRQLRGLLDLSKRSAAQSVADVVADHLAEDLAGALELPLVGGAPDRQVAMAGSRNAVRFNAVVRVGFQKRALRQVSFSIEERARASVLVRTALPRRLSPVESMSSDDRLVLHPSINGITFRYMTIDAAGNAVWLDNWSGQTLLPRAVRFQIELSEKSDRISASRTVGILR